MKISPVQGIPTIPNPSATGLSPDKLAAIKAMAEGKPKPEEVEKETIQLGEVPTSATQRIQMNVNRSPDRDMPIVEENAPLEAPKAEVVAEPVVGTPDSSVQAQPILGDTKVVSPQLAQLAKERQALRLEREQLVKDREALKGLSSEDLIKKLKSSPLSVLQEHGVTYDQLTNEILGQQGNNEVNALKAEVEALKKGIDERFTAKDTQQEESVYNYMKANVDKMSFSSNDYKLIRESKSQDKVMDLVKRMWKEHGEILDETEAMDLIEAELREDARRYAKLIGEIESPPEKQVEEVEVPTKSAPGKTLTNKDSARPVMGRRQRAIAAMLGQKH